MKRKNMYLITVIIMFFISTLVCSAGDLTGSITFSHGLGGAIDFVEFYDIINDITEVEVTITLTETAINTVLNQAPGSLGDPASLGNFYLTMIPVIPGTGARYNYTNKGFYDTKDIVDAKQEVSDLMDIEAGSAGSPNVWPTFVKIQHFNGTSWVVTTNTSTGGKTIRQNLMEEMGLINPADLIYGENFRFYMPTNQYILYAFERSITNIWPVSGDPTGTRQYIKVSYDVKFPITAYLGTTALYTITLEEALATGSDNIVINSDIIINEDIQIPPGTTVTIKEGVTVEIGSGVNFVNNGVLNLNGDIVKDAEHYYTVSNKVTNGTIDTSTNLAREGEIITLTLTPNSGYKLSSINVMDSGGNSVSVSNNSFVMPASNVFITVFYGNLNPQTSTLNLAFYIALFLVSFIGIVYIICKKKEA